MFRRDFFFKQSPWSWKEMALLLGLVLILVPFFVEFLLMHVLTEWFQNKLYSGTLIGFIMSVIFTLGVYFIAIKPKGLSCITFNVISLLNTSVLL